jgi:hypothetical protein
MQDEYDTRDIFKVWVFCSAMVADVEGNTDRSSRCLAEIKGKIRPVVAAEEICVSFSVTDAGKTGVSSMVSWCSGGASQRKRPSDGRVGSSDTTAFGLNVVAVCDEEGHARVLCKSCSQIRVLSGTRRKELPIHWP